MLEPDDDRTSTLTSLTILYTRQACSKEKDGDGCVPAYVPEADSMLRALDIAALVDAFDDSLERIDVVLEDRFRPRELNLLAQWLLDRRERVRFHLSESLAEQTNLCRQLSESGFRTTVSCEPAGAVYGSGCAAEGPQGGRQWIILPDGRVYADLRHSPLGMVTDTLSRLRLRMERERQSPGARDAGGPDREES